MSARRAAISACAFLSDAEHHRHCRRLKSEVAIYLRGGKFWIADFIDGVGELIEPEALVPLQLRLAMGASRPWRGE